MQNIKCCEIIPSSTPTTTPTITPTYTPTTTLTATTTPTSTVTPTFTPTNTVTPTFTPTNTVTPTFTPTNTISPTVTPTNTVSPTVTPTNTVTITTTPTNTPTNTVSMSPTPSVSPTRAGTPTPTLTKTSTPTPTPTLTISQTQTITPSNTSTSTPTQTLTSTPTPTVTVSCLAGSASNWTEITSSVPDILSSTDLADVAVSKNGNNIIICGIENDYNFSNPASDGRVYISTNRGISWSRITNYSLTGGSTQLFGPRALSCVGVSPNGQIMAIGSYPDGGGAYGDSRAFVSINSGSSFKYSLGQSNRRILCIQPTNSQNSIWLGTNRTLINNFPSSSWGSAYIISFRESSISTRYSAEAGGGSFPLSRTSSLSGFTDIYVSDTGSKVVCVTWGGKIWINNDANNTNNWSLRGPDNIWTGITGTSDGSTLYACACQDFDTDTGWSGDPGVFKSTDGGENWSKVTSFPSLVPCLGIYGISMSEDGRRILVGDWYGGHISHDYGNTWGQLIVYMNNSYVDIVTDSFDLANNGSLAISAYGKNPAKVYISKCS